MTGLTASSLIIINDLVNQNIYESAIGYELTPIIRPLEIVARNQKNLNQRRNEKSSTGELNLKESNEPSKSSKDLGEPQINRITQSTGFSKIFG